MTLDWTRGKILEYYYRNGNSQKKILEKRTAARGRERAGGDVEGKGDYLVLCVARTQLLHLTA